MFRLLRHIPNRMLFGAVIGVAFVIMGIVGTFAMIDYAQTKIVAHEGNIPTYRVVLNKNVVLYSEPDISNNNCTIDISGDNPCRTPTNITVHGAIFDLYRNNHCPISPAPGDPPCQDTLILNTYPIPGSSPPIVDGHYYTDLLGQIHAPNLDDNDYYFLEISPSSGYTPDKASDGTDITRYNFNIPNDVDAAGDVVTVSAYNIPEYVQLGVSKQLLDPSVGIGDLGYPKVWGTSDSEAESCFPADPIASPSIQIACKDVDFTFNVKFQNDATYRYCVVNTADCLAEADMNCADIDSLELLLPDSDGNFTLKAGQTALFDNLPAGISYVVDEIESPYYTRSADTTSDILNGTIDYNRKRVIINNQPNLLSKLRVTKNVVPEPQCAEPLNPGDPPRDDADCDAEFNFFLEVWVGSDSIFFDGFNLSTGGEFIIDDLPIGARWEVSEAFNSDYVAEDLLLSGLILPTDNLAHFVNLIPAGLDGNLEVSKTVDVISTLPVSPPDLPSEAWKDQEFIFDIGFSDTDSHIYLVNCRTITDDCLPEEILAPTFAQITAGEKTHGQITLKSGDFIYFPDLPEGVIYTVVEQDYTAEGYTTIGGNRTGQIIGSMSVNVDVVNQWREPPPPVCEGDTSFGTWPDCYPPCIWDPLISSNDPNCQEPPPEPCQWDPNLTVDDVNCVEPEDEPCDDPAYAAAHTTECGGSPPPCPVGQHLENGACTPDFTPEPPPTYEPSTNTDLPPSAELANTGLPFFIMMQILLTLFILYYLIGARRTARRKTPQT